MNEKAKQDSKDGVPFEKTTTISSTDNEKKHTIGEELFLEHLNRITGLPPSEDDFDREYPRQRSRSVGEELWEVHVKRSCGMEPDFDVEAATNTKNKNKITTPTKATRKVKTKKPDRSSERLIKVMHLRNRDVKTMLIR